jgi:tRNA A37 threonylcarbamoyltransferase TsaD
LIKRKFNSPLQRALLNIQELSMLELNFEGMKRILTATNDTSKQEEVNKEKKEQLAKSLKEQDFDELMNFNEASVSAEIFNLFSFNSHFKPFSPPH